MHTQTLQREDTSGPQTLQRPGTTAGAGTMWRIDPLHSTIGFSIKHMKLATVHGRFGGFRGMIRLDGEPSHGALVEVHIDAGTIDTGEPRRDAHLRSADFFDAAAYPTIAFHSTHAEPISQLAHNRWLVAGNLTMHGVTRPVELAVEQTGGGPNPWDAEVTSFAVTTTVRRREFGLGVTFPLAGGGLVIGDDVAVAIDVQALRDPIWRR